ncbi:D-inositol 3-phosphate glycosyltransferase [Baekduia alba]|uniref:glycosyltransferase family 4 protein n=1 Tax=Baekduia alba TaxID=2997333 RepID=UPI0023407801|nr:glycosyltransferase family 4 protein [Baekduia alba]WCB91434.1 D-inositol 3-phosphate glycosyltransferase [Baekduia alba]
MRVDVVDPSAFTPPYDRALAAALARAGAQVRLVTSRFAYGDVPPAEGYGVDERFYRRAAGVGAPGSKARLVAKLAEHVPEMVAYARGAARAADVVHFQWLTVQPLDVHLLPRGVPTVLTAHDVLPREPRAGQLRAQRRLYERVDHVVVHSAHGAARLTRELGIDPARVTVIPHGAFTHLAALDARLPPELAPGPDTPVVALPGLLRRYKGVDVLLDAWRRFGADPPGELWIVGMPRMPLPDPATLPPGVRIVARFVDDAELAGVLRRADLIALPYRAIDQSGVLYAALGLGRPLLLSAVGGFPEVAATGAAELVAPDDPAALHAALATLLADPRRRAALAASAQEAARTTYSWDAIAQQHLALYAMLRRS